MSFKAFVWAWGQELAKDEHLIVLLALADICNESGTLYASHAYIAKHARRNERTVRRALAAMDGGAITISERPGRTDLIRLNIPAEFMVSFPKEEEHEQGKRGRPRKTLAKVSENPGHGDGKPPTKESDEPKTLTGGLTTVVKSTREAFEIWWKAYPLKKAKDAAARAFESAWGRVEGDNRLDVLLSAIAPYADECRRLDRRLKHPATWLNGGCWNDEPDTTNRSQTDGQSTRSPTANADRQQQRIATLRPMAEGAQEALNRRRGRRWKLPTDLD